MTAYNDSMPVSSVAQTGVTSLDALLGGTKWGGGAGSGATVTFSFPWTTNSTAQWYRDGAGNYSSLNEPFATYHYALDFIQMQAARAAVQSWANVANVQLQEISESGSTVGDIRFAWTSANAGIEWGHANYPWSGWAPGGDIWIYSGMAYPSTDWSVGSHNYKSLLHEIGHALGLKHPGNYDTSGGGVSPPYLPLSQDEQGLTVMSYTNAVGYPDSTLSFYPTTPMWYDIAALQYLYGPNMSYHSGNDAYVYHAGQNYFQTIWDAGGIDTIQYVSGFSGGVIDLRPGNWSELGVEREIYTSSGTFVSSATVNIYSTVTIENAIGGDGADTIIGNGVANSLMGGDGADSLTGGAGNDTLTGGAGVDTLRGGAGNDSYIVGAGDAVSELAGQGKDLVKSSVSHTLRSNVDNLTLTGANAINGTGNTLANTITGNGAGNTLSGGSGGDTLRGLGGADVLRGSAGNDTLTGGAGADRFDLNAALSATTNVDRITDFNLVSDLIRLDNDVFTAFVPVNVAVTADAFRKGAGVATAGDAEDRIIYNSTNGNLYYDPDGVGGTGATLFAALANAPTTITAADFFIVA